MKITRLFKQSLPLALCPLRLSPHWKRCSRDRPKGGHRPEVLRQTYCAEGLLWLLQLLYMPQPQGLSRDLQWSTYVWRRGTVPIWWGVEIKSGGVGEATIVVSNDKPYRGTRRSVQGLNVSCTEPDKNSTPQRLALLAAEMHIPSPHMHG